MGYNLKANAEYLHLRIPGGLKERVRAVARLEHKNIVTVITEFFLSYLAQKEPIYLRQAAEAREAARIAAIDNGATEVKISTPRQIKQRPAAQPQPAPASVQP